MATFSITENSMWMSSTVESRHRRSESRHTEATVLDESSFLRMLCLERKRTERSGRPILLVMVSAGERLKYNGEELVSCISQAVANSIRETDTLGWYEEGKTLAVLFTEIGSATENVPLIASKLQKALQDTLTQGQFDALDITFRVFPVDTPSRGNGEQRDLVFYPDLSRGAESRRAARLLKRTIDVAGSLFLLALSWPIFLITAILLKLTSDGLILFRQKRVGQHGRLFTFLKFRSMYSNNDPSIHQEYVARLIEGKAECSQSAGGTAVYKLTNDPRVTPLGRFLRKTSLDELPQLINVLRGEMSLVGPRPSVPYEFERYSLWHRRRVFEVKPGITGLWQVLGRSRTTFDEMVRLDLNYAKAWSIRMDTEILWKTPMAVFRTDGAY
jgi:lipopolysaccharide/colanic/teichoic acid biosynthesis glycosyltransferase